ncbi:serine/threonine-protein kinase [Microbispora bryophytorum]|uniref:Serine/threonine protein kinase n=1 Tax=Microbispora bryophytorum subsp. camponoti TaxID=1677852 RepID=A0ABR8L1E7_9ACTN|nr:serine/threonine-protein kinase [Microbispora camponoti]MBD3144815.1 serine/threonine protein kinase [Microbispora camponoti]
MDAQPSAGDSTATHRRTIGPYIPVRRLGEGGMGIVYLARDPEGRQVALKVMRPELAAQEEFRARFRKEAEAAKRVARFCTAPLLDAGQDGDRHYLVTEYVDGPDLSAVIDAQGPLPGSNLDALAVGVATALAAIHEAGIVHRDLKPSNILLSPLGPRVIDFGVAHLADTLAERTGTVIGTPSYMPPEQARGEPVTSAADVFAWGCVVAYAATGRPPFGGGAAPEVLYRVAHHVPHLTGMDERLRPLVEQALDKDPARRPSAQRLLDRLLGREEVAVEAATRIVTDIWAAPGETTRQAGPGAGAAPYGADGTDGPDRTGPRGTDQGDTEQGGGRDRGGTERSDAGAGGTGGRRGRRWVPVAVAGGALAVAAAILLVTLRPFGGGTTPKGPLAARDVTFNGSSLHVTVDSVRRRGTSVSVQLTVTLMDGNRWWPRNVFGDQMSGAALVDPPSGSKFVPASKDGGCLCSALPGQLLNPGDVLPLYATYTGVPEGLDEIGFDVPGFGLFADLPLDDA